MGNLYKDGKADPGAALYLSFFGEPPNEVTEENMEVVKAFIRDTYKTGAFITATIDTNTDDENIGPRLLAACGFKLEHKGEVDYNGNYQVIMTMTLSAYY